jgi:hypothetical protein
MADRMEPNRSLARRPVSGAMVNAEDVNGRVRDSIHNDVGKAGKDQFAGSGYFPDSAPTWENTQVIRRIEK